MYLDAVEHSLASQLHDFAFELVDPCVEVGLDYGVACDLFCVRRDFEQHAAGLAGSRVVRLVAPVPFVDAIAHRKTWKTARNERAVGQDYLVLRVTRDQAVFDVFLDVLAVGHAVVRVTAIVAGTVVS